MGIYKMESCANFIYENTSFDKHVQQEHKLISWAFSNNKEIAADFMAFILIHIGTFRNYAFFESLMSNKRLDFGIYNDLSTIIGTIFLCFGSLLWITALLKLGLRGSYFGDHFGFVSNKKVDSFPFNVLENPQYNGSKIFLLGQSIITRSVIGVVLTLFISFLYTFVFFIFEKKNMNDIYTVEEDNKKKIE